LEPRCPEPATYRGRCATHSRQREKATHPNKRLYNSRRWEYARRRQLFDHPLCQCDNPECNEIATDVDHIVPIEKGGDPFDRANLQSLAHDCHSRKTRREQGVTT
jgi:5-methylcytosine-specific restriction protein A